VSASDKQEVGQGGTSRPGLNLWRVLLAVAALDAFALGLFGVAHPGWPFENLGMEERHDSWAWQLLVPRGDPPDGIPTPRDAGLWQLLALLSLAHAGFLALAAWRPRSLGGLAVVPLIGHALGAALWLWALATTYTFPQGRVPFPHREPLWLLAAHDAVWLPPLLAFLLVWRRRAARDGKEIAARVQ
jgi:hypothetical protein